jgi:cysteine synthase A
MKTGFIHEVIGETPLIKIKSLSEITGCEIFGKAEFLNPGGSIKDRAALAIIEDAERQGLLKNGYSIVEGTAGNTGIGLATHASQKGYKVVVVMPNNQSQEKYDTLNALGVEVITVPTCPFANENHFYHQARKLSESRPHLFWANQFENPANWQGHYRTTGPEIWQQTHKKVDAFVSAVGSGGTIAGVSKFLKEQNKNIFIRLADPYGSGMLSYIQSGEIKTEGSSITEGIGIMRLTTNFKEAKIDDGLRVSDGEMYSMLVHLAKNDGILVGTSGALNVFAAFKYAIEHRNKKKTIVTMLCDSALRYQSKIFNSDFLKEKALVAKPIESYC